MPFLLYFFIFGALVLFCRVRFSFLSCFVAKLSNRESQRFHWLFPKTDPKEDAVTSFDCSIWKNTSLGLWGKRCPGANSKMQTNLKQCLISRTNFHQTKGGRESRICFIILNSFGGLVQSAESLISVWVKEFQLSPRLLGIFSTKSSFAQEA